MARKSRATPPTNSDTRNEIEYPKSSGKTTIAPEVLLTIARLTTLEVEGVSRMSSVPAGFNKLFNRKFGEGVRLEIQDDVVNVDIFIILKSDVSIREVSRTIQFEVCRAISEMVGMQVGFVNIHVEDIDYPTETEQA